MGEKISESGKKLGKEEVSTVRMDIPIRNLTIGYPNSVKVRIKDQVIDIHGPIEIVSDASAKADHRASIEFLK